jgi:hypothetical protein
MDADPNRQVKAAPGSGSKVANAPGSSQARSGDAARLSSAVDEGQASVEDDPRSCGPFPPPEAPSGRTPLREAEGDPCSRGSLDSYRVTDRNGGNGEKLASHVSSQTGEDCPYPIEIGVDEWDRETGELEDSGIVLLPCGRKGCPVCGPRLRDRYTAHFARTFAELGESRPMWFLTLTVDPKVLPDDADELDARKYLTHCWEKYRKRLRRRAEDLKYAGAYEVHRDGDRWHLHMVVAADFPDRETESEIREMLRVQWFESGGGAVAKVKRVREGRREPSTDGTPDGIAGAAGYVVKYAFKDAAHAHSAAESRRSVLASEGIGYYSEDARDERRAFREDQATGGESAVEREYRPLVTGGMEAVGEDDRGRADTLTKDDRERFEGWDKSGRTMEYKERVEDSEEWDGRTVWILWAFAPDAGRLHRTVWDTFPERTDAQKLADSWPSTAYDGGDT